MPHISTYGGSYFSAQPEKEDFGSFEPREAKFQEASTNDELTGRKPLNWSELCDVGTSLRKSDDFIKLGDIKGDRLFTTGGGGDSITGEGRSTKIWTNGGASTFEDRPVGDYDANDAVFSMRENLGSSGPGGSTFMTETFEPALGMEFAGSLNPAPGLGGTAGPVCKSYLEPQLGWGEICDVGTT